MTEEKEVWGLSLLLLFLPLVPIQICYMLTLAWYQLSKQAAPGLPELWPVNVLISCNSIHFAVICLVLEMSIFLKDKSWWASCEYRFQICTLKMDLAQTSKCDSEKFEGFPRVTVRPLDIRDLHISHFWNLLPLPLRAARLHTPWTQHTAFVYLMTLWFTALGSGLVSFPPSRPKTEFSARLLTWLHLISDHSAL